jgi:cell division protein FtsB
MIQQTLSMLPRIGMLEILVLSGFLFFWGTIGVVVFRIFSRIAATDRTVSTLVKENRELREEIARLR